MVDIIFGGKKVYIQFKEDIKSEEYLFHTFMDAGIVVESLSQKDTVIFFPLHNIQQIYFSR